MANKIAGGSSTAGIANVDTGFNLNVTLPKDEAQMGGALLFSENDPGDVTGTPHILSPETSDDYRLRVGMDSVWDTDDFNFTAQNFNKHKYTSTTLTASWAGGSFNTNASGITTTAAAVQLQTYRSFPVIGSGQVYAEQTIAFDNTIGTNINIDFGMMLQVAAGGTAIPQDGIYFRANSNGLMGVINNNGTETTTSVFTFTPVINTAYKFVVAISRDSVHFWIDDVLYGQIDRPAASGKPSYMGSLPWGIRHHHTGTAGSIVRTKVFNYTITVGDIDTNRLWATVQAGQGNSGVNYPGGTTTGQTTNSANSTVPATATLANATAGYPTLGGQFVFAAVAGAETDYALFAFLNPVPNTSVSGRNLVIRGVWIDIWNQVVAVATTPTVFQWYAAVGSTSVTLATTDGATTRLPKRQYLGSQSLTVGALVGQMAQRVDCNLDAPLVVEPGTYFHIILKMPIGTATATETFRGNVGVNAYWE